MGIEGQLSIQLYVNETKIQCQLSSSRPLYASRLFIGKPIDTVLKTMPMLFNICGKAQTIATLRAAENSLNQAARTKIELQREALIWLESLREQVLRVLLDWPIHLNKTADPELLAVLSQRINRLSQKVNSNQSLLTRFPIVNKIEQQKTWASLQHLIERSVLGKPSQLWLEEPFDINAWAKTKATIAAHFVYWLQQQTWRHQGTSSISPLNSFNNNDLQQRLDSDEYEFTRRPDWQGLPYELSGFNEQRHYPLVTNLLEKYGNGIYTRVIARLVGIANLVQKLDRFFSGSQQVLICHIDNGMAHVNAARGRLTHRIQLDKNTKIVKQLNIIAPTEWNFHPEGVAAKSLENLQGNDIKQLEQQAHCLIHTIDPCVAYQLSIGVFHARNVSL